MISSIDPGKLESIMAFANLMEIIKNADSYRDFVEDAKKTLAELSEVLQAKATVDGADKYAKERAEAIKKQQDELEQKKNEFDVMVEQKNHRFGMRLHHHSPKHTARVS